MPAALALAAALFFEAAAARADDAPPRPGAAPPPASTRSPLAAEALTAGPQSDSTKERIAELIKQLGDSRYTTRRAAATELRHIGAEAFDMLHAATADKDPEIAASARYLLRQIAVRWVRPEDTPAVRVILREYDRKADNARLGAVRDLAQLADGEGIAALCRIARFDRSPVVSRSAAVAVIRPDDDRESAPTLDADIVAMELRGSSRTAVQWLRHYLMQLRNPAASVESWQRVVDAEIARLEQNTAETSPAIVGSLLWNLAEVHRKLGNHAALSTVVNQMIDVNPDALEPTAIELLNWLTKHESWQALDDFLANHQTQLEQSKRPLYHAAIARAKQGKSEEAERLAEKAAQLDPQHDLESFVTAKDLEEHGQFKWAVREYRRNVDDARVASHEGILARIYLAGLLHDYEKHVEAANVLEPLVKAVENEGQVGKLYTELYRLYERRLPLPSSEELAGRLHYYRALQYRDAKDHRRERDSLELAYRFDPSNPDILIAMYRVPDAEESWKATVRQRIEQLCRQVQQKIDENPNEPDGYNQWAWLVSNTEGDFQKAIRYSHRSLELIPPGAGESAGASFLDTLGRCYFAVGDLENALKYQRRAVEKVGYMQVMQRQLDEFERAYAEKHGASATKQQDEAKAN